MTRGRGRLGLTIGILLAPAVLGAAVAALRGQSAEGENLRILFPRDQCVLESGQFDLVCVKTNGASDQEPAPDLRVDGEAATWAPYRQPVLTSRLDLEAGRHEITIGEKGLQVYVRSDEEASGAPDGWPVYRSHQASTEGWKDCSSCHELTQEDGLSVLGEAKQPEACSQCHSAIDFEGTHFHPREPLEACHTCHGLHGSTGVSLLNGEVKKLCAECHE